MSAHTEAEQEAAPPAYKPWDAKHDRRSLRALCYRLFWIVTALLVWVAIDCILEPAMSPLHALQLFQGPRSADHVLTHLSALSRILGVLLAAAITLCGIAIPLTANAYTPKLIGLFIKDRVNWSMFGLLVCANVLVHWTTLVTVGPEPPVYNILLVTLLAISAIALVIPYAFYVFRALDPQSIVLRIEQEILADLREVVGGEAHHLDELRDRIAANLKNLSNIVLRSLDRHDRDTALFGIESLGRLFEIYQGCRATLPRAWFTIRAADFLGKPPEVLRQVEETNTFFEVELLDECTLLLGVAMERSREVVRTLGVLTRTMGTAAVARAQPEVFLIVCSYFNSFIRAAISKRNSDSIYMLSFQYRLLGEHMIHIGAPESVPIAFYLDYYAHQAVRTGIVFVVNVIAYDLAALALLALERGSPQSAELLRLFVRFDRCDDVAAFPGVIKSRIKVLIALKVRGEQVESRSLLEKLARLDPEVVARAIEEIESVTTPYYWEITDRRLHLDYLSPESRPSFELVKAQLLNPEAGRRPKEPT